MSEVYRQYIQELCESYIRIIFIVFLFITVYNYITYDYKNQLLYMTNLKICTKSEGCMFCENTILNFTKSSFSIKQYPISIIDNSRYNCIYNVYDDTVRFVDYKTFININSNDLMKIK